jgi:hypothetical protein
MPLKRVKPVQSIVARKALAPTKTLVSRTPAEQFATLDVRIAEVTARMRRLRVAATAAVMGGLAIFVGLMGVTWAFTDYILFWGAPAVLLGGSVGAYCAKVSGELGNDLRALSLERRALAKQIPDQPYGHAPAEAP